MNAPWITNRESMAGHRKAVAEALGVSVSLANHWCEPLKECGGIGDHSPLERHIDTVLVLRRAGAPNAEMQVQDFLAAVGYLPGIRIGELAAGGSLIQVAEIIRSVGEAAAEYGADMGDGVMESDEARRYASKLRTALGTICREIAALDEFIAHAEEIEVRERIGPKGAKPKHIGERYFEIRRSA